MKKLLLASFVFLTLVSCKQKLPSNVSSAVFSVKFDTDLTRGLDSLIVSLDKNSIDNMSEDSLRRIMSSVEFKDKQLEKSEKELDEILKYSPQYSDYDEIKNMERRYMYTNQEKYYLNFRYIEDRETYLFRKGLGGSPDNDVPVYGELGTKKKEIK